MTIRSAADADFAPFRASLRRRATPPRALERTVREIIQAVEERGDQALLDFAARFDGAEFPLAQLHVDAAELAAASATLAPELAASIEAARENVAAFAEAGRPQDYTRQNAQGVTVGARYQPLQRVGIYVPGGSAPLISTVIMSVEIARVAGCEEIVVCTPPGPGGAINAALLAALHRCGATEVIRAGGAQAIAALGLGTESIRPVAKVFGPGNRFVVEAKRQLFGTVGVDLLPGPSEILVLADESAEEGDIPRWIAADLLGQAEHGPDSVVACVSPSRTLLDAVAAAIQTQAARLSRQGPLLEVLAQRLHLIQVPDLAAGIDLANDFAAEHLSLLVADPDAVVPQLRTTGEIFVGAHTPVALGDYLAGPSHTLPTGGAGHAFSGLSIADFYRKTGLVHATPAAIAASAPLIETLAFAEGLDAHAASARVRLEHE